MNETQSTVTISLCGWPSKRGVRRNDDVTWRRNSLLSMCSMYLRFAWPQCWITVVLSCSCWTWKYWSTQEYSICAVLEQIVFCAWLWRKLSLAGEQYNNEVMQMYSSCFLTYKTVFESISCHHALSFPLVRISVSGCTVVASSSNRNLQISRGETCFYRLSDEWN